MYKVFAKKGKKYKLRLSHEWGRREYNKKIIKAIRIATRIESVQAGP